VTQQPHRPRLMALGLDGLSLQVLLPLAQAGELPHFARLLERGAWGMLLSVANITTGPTWSSFSTGCSPAHHVAPLALQALAVSVPSHKRCVPAALRGIGGIRHG